MTMTKREKFKLALEKMGYTEIESRSRKYVTMDKPGCRYVYLGKSGAVRRGTTISGSVPVSDCTKKNLLNSVEI